MSNRLALIVSFAGKDQLSGALKNIIGTGRTAKTVLKDTAREAAGLQRELKRVNREMAAGGDVYKLIGRQRELQQQLDRTNGQLAKQKRLMAIDDTVAKVGAKGDALKSRGQENMIQGAALAAPLILATKAAGDFSSGMVDIQQKANLTNAEADRLANNIILAAKAARRMPEDMRLAVDVLAGKGLDPLQASKMVPAIGRLGTAFKVDLADGAAAAYANLNNLKVPLGQTSAALDIMAASGNAGAFEIRDMARHFPALTAQMQAMGESGLSAVGNLSAALQIAEKGTGNADQAANNIQNLLAKINAPGTINAFKKNFGVDLPAAMKKLKGQGLDTFEAIATITKNATKGDLQKLGFGFEDMQAQGAVRSLIQNLDEYRKVRDGAMKSSGTIDKAFDQRMLRDANVGWAAMKGQLSEAAITLGTTLLPVMVTTLGYVNSMAGAVSSWAREHPQAAAAIMQIVAGLAVFKIGLGAVQFAFGGLLGPAARAWGLFAKFRAIGGLAKTFAILKTAGLGFGRAMLFVGRALMMNPIGILVTAIGVAAYLIYTHWDKIKAAFAIGISYLGQAWAWLKANARSILQFSGPIGQAALFIWDNWATIKQAFSGALSFIGGLVSRFVSVGKQIIDGLVAGITAAPGKIWAALKNIISGAWTSAKDFLGINSPSRLFMAMGGGISQGLAVGIDRGGRQPMGSMKRLAAGVAAAGAMSLAPAYAATGAPGSRGPGPGGGGDTWHVTIKVVARDGQSAQDIAREVKRELDRLQDSRRRTSFDDDDA